MKVAILGPGNIARKMGDTLRELSKSADPSLQELCYAAGSRDLGRAKAFAEEFGFKKAYGSYEELVSDPEVDLVYVATPHSCHYDNCRLALEHGKHVLCEKCFTMNAAEAASLFELADSKGLLLAEAAWPRYAPFYSRIREIVDSGVLGDVHSLSASLGYPVMHKERLREKSMGGGALMDVGVYTIYFASAIFGWDIKDIRSHAVMSDSGVDLQSFTVLTYTDGRVASLHSTAIDCTSHHGVVCGEKAVLEVDDVNNPKYAALYGRSHDLIQEFHAEPQFNGFEYQVLACRDAIAAGMTECPVWPHAETLSVMKLVDSISESWSR